ncbi:hypothetical protein TWF970_008304 [Orbilia oligospora]|uniref:Uncharacterized protein n=1 Tax=Orbilia oligospora TaxID=2813651 RepID=A0A7C8V9W9_ORBOL|nr:hypothetical protein TWF970_008304 [Orbilia oligospora]
MNATKSNLNANHGSLLVVPSDKRVRRPSPAYSETESIFSKVSEDHSDITCNERQIKFVRFYPKIPGLIPRFFDCCYETVEVFLTAPFFNSKVADAADSVVGNFFQETNKMRGNIWTTVEDLAGNILMYRIQHPSTPYVNHYENEIEVIGDQFGGAISVYLQLTLPWYFHPMNITKSFVVFAVLLMTVDFWSAV